MQSIAIPAPPSARRRDSLFTKLSIWLELRRQRAQLAALDDRALADIGLTRREVERELKRPAWNVPAHWVRK
ncbi:DUF1127 domain-containing protein [Halodurantibacterium flavum]|uniref:DUF1127 domain-containing protein n=1 Tax=Halodurantibacterium flavum TaxID=1382802 RepID=A0ABW4S2C8_9RHOB